MQSSVINLNNTTSNFYNYCVVEGHCWYIGVGIALGNSFISALANNLIKLSHINGEIEPKSRIKILLPWATGMILLIFVNSGLNVVALMFASLVICFFSFLIILF